MDVTSPWSGPKTTRESMFTASGWPALTMTPASFVVVTWTETGRRSWRRGSSGLCSAFRAGQALEVICELRADLPALRRVDVVALGAQEAGLRRRDLHDLAAAERDFALQRQRRAETGGPVPPFLLSMALNTRPRSPSGSATGAVTASPRA